MTFLDAAVVNLALPAIRAELGGGLTSQQWIVDAYLLSLGSLILLAGSLSDMFGRVRILQVGLIGFAATSVLCGLAPTDLILIIGRGLQGVAGALLVPSSLALIISAFSGAAQGKAIGQWIAWTGAATLVAPLIGGLAVDLLSWRFIFFINILPVIVALPLLAKLLPTDTRSGGRVDYLGAVLAALALAGPVYALIEQATFGWQSPAVLIPLVLGLIALVLFLWHERRTSEPMMPLSLFRVRNFAVGNIATFAIYGALMFGLFVLTIYLQQRGGFSATWAGLALLPTTVLILLLSSYFGALAGRIGPHWLMTAGPAVSGIGFLLMLRISAELNYWTELLPGIVVFGLGMSITVAPLTAAIMGSIDTRQAGIGSAINNAVSRIAGVITIALAGIITGSALDLDGMRRAILATAVLFFAAAVISAVGIRNRPIAPDRA